MNDLTGDAVSDADYKALATFRYALRRFLRHSHEAAAAAGLETQQYQALLAIRGRGTDALMTIGDLAEELQIRPNSAVGMAQRLDERGFITRTRGETDRRRVFITLTDDGRKVLAQLAAAHKAELIRAIPAFDVLLQQLAK
jgi:DNA-binding MarR family transcriptional regulator